MNNDPTFQPGTYRHYRTGDLYSAIALVTHHHTRQPMVVYVSHAKGSVNVRPLNGWPEDPDAWNDLVFHNDGLSHPGTPGVSPVKRFQYLEKAEAPV